MHQGGEGGQGGGPEDPPRRRRAAPVRRKLGREGGSNQGGGRGGDSDGGNQNDEPSREFRVVLSGIATAKHTTDRGFGRGHLVQAINQVRLQGGAVPFLFPLRLLRPQMGALAIAFVDYMALTTFAFDLAEDPLLLARYGLRARGESLAKRIYLPSFRTYANERFPDLPQAWKAYVNFSPLRFGSLTWLQKVGIAAGLIAATSSTMATAPTAVRNYNEIYGPALQDAMKAVDEYVALFSERAGEILDVKVVPASPQPIPRSPAGEEAPGHPSRRGTRKRRKPGPAKE